MSKDNDQIAAASDLGGKRRYTLEEALARQAETYATLKQETEAHRLIDLEYEIIPVDDDATRTLERVKALLVEALKESAPGRPGWGQTYAAWQEIEALEARREAGK